MGSYLQNTEYERLDYFHPHRSPAERDELRKTFGDLPDGDIFPIDLRAVLAWGRPWWRICEVVYGRNDRKDQLTDQDDFTTWKALLFTLAQMVQTYRLPKRMRGTTCVSQWREDIFNDALSWLWILVKSARGKSLRIRDTAWLAITRSCRASGVQKVPANFEIDRFLDRYEAEVDVAELAARNLDKAEEESLLDRRVAVRLEYRLSDTFHPGSKEIYQAVKAGNPAACRKHRWMRQMIELHRRLVRHACKNRAKGISRGVGPLLLSDG